MKYSGRLLGDIPAKKPPVIRLGALKFVLVHCGNIAEALAVSRVQHEQLQRLRAAAVDKDGNIFILSRLSQRPRGDDFSSRTQLPAVSRRSVWKMVDFWGGAAYLMERNRQILIGLAWENIQELSETSVSASNFCFASNRSQCGPSAVLTERYAFSVIFIVFQAVDPNQEVYDIVRRICRLNVGVLGRPKHRCFCAEVNRAGFSVGKRQSLDGSLFRDYGAEINTPRPPLPIQPLSHSKNQLLPSQKRPRLLPRTGASPMANNERLTREESIRVS